MSVYWCIYMCVHLILSFLPLFACRRCVFVRFTFASSDAFPVFCFFSTAFFSLRFILVYFTLANNAIEPCSFTISNLDHIHIVCLLTGFTNLACLCSLSLSFSSSSPFLFRSRHIKRAAFQNYFLIIVFTSCSHFSVFAIESFFPHVFPASNASLSFAFSFFFWLIFSFAFCICRLNSLQFTSCTKFFKSSKLKQL